MTPIPDLFVVGTDTGVGKSVVSLLLMRLLFRLGYDPFYLKPFQTGCASPAADGSDAAFVYRHTPALRGSDPAPSVLSCLSNPKAPFFAARDEGRTPDWEAITETIARHRRKRGPLVVEGAGGLMVPVTEHHMVLDLIESTGCRPLLVARTGLGTINHTLLSIEALRHRQVPPMGVVLVAAGRTPVDPELVAENMTAVADYGKIPVAGVVPFIEDFGAPPGDADLALRRLLFAETP